MPYNPSCCFCNNKYLFESYGVDAIIGFFRYSRSCESCLKSLKAAKLLATGYDELSSYFKELHFFIPAIDADLIPRFAKTLGGLEQYSFAFSSKAALNLNETKQLIVVKDLIINRVNNYIPNFTQNSNILVTRKLDVTGIHLSSETSKYLYQSLFGSTLSKQVTIKAKVIELCSIEITANIFYLLLSPQLAEFKCVKVELTTDINPFDFIEMVPNIEKFIFEDSNDNPYTNVWDFRPLAALADLPINCKALNNFCVSFNDLNLTFESFNLIVQNWSKNQISIFQNLHDIDDNFIPNFYSETNLRNLYLSLTKNE